MTPIASDEKLLGHFTEEGRCFVLTNPTATPRPWLNCLYSDHYYVNCDQFGRGMTQVQDGEGHWALMVLRSEQYGFVGDKGVYLRDEETGEYWDAGWSYTRRAFRDHRVEIRPGSVNIHHRYLDIEISWEIRVPAEDPAELWTLAIKNAGGKPRRLGAYGFHQADLSGYSAPKGSAAGRPDSYWRATIERDWNGIHCRSTAPFIEWDRYGLVFASDLKPAAFQTCAETFLGVGGHFGAPGAMKDGRLDNLEAAGEQMVAVLHLALELDPGVTQTARFLAAPVGHDRALAEKLIGRYLGAEDHSARLCRNNPDAHRFSIRSPSEVCDRMANVWLPKQVGVCARFSRGWGQGYRDTLQDSCALQLIEPALNHEAPSQILRILEGCLRTQYPDGNTPRVWSPLNRENYSDGPCWLIEAVTRHVHVSGDAGFLRREFPFLDAAETAPVHEHLTRAINVMLVNRGRHGLVKIQGGDWNDGVTGAGRRGEGESVLNTVMLVRNLRELKVLRERLGSDDPWTASWDAAEAELVEALKSRAWDGAYYRRAYDDDGRPLGAIDAEEGKIFLEPQAFALMAGLPDAADAAKLIQSVEDMLETPYGCRLLFPSYRRYNPHIGRLTGHVPGMWENGAIYCHATAFYLHGLCRYGQADRAYRLFHLLLGTNALNPSAQSGVEPYIMTNCYSGPEHPTRPGVSRYGWWTGTAGWALRYLGETLPGVEPQYGGIFLRPSGLPSEWKEMTVNRVVRGRSYSFRVIRGGAKTPGVSWNGRALETPWLPDAEAHPENQIIVDWRG